MPQQVKSFFDTVTSTWSHVLWDSQRRNAAIIDPVLDYDPDSGRSDTNSADRLVDFVRSEKLRLDWIVESHAHADHLSSAQYLKQRLGGVIAISSGIKTVQKTFGQLFNLGRDFALDGSQFDKLIDDGETLMCGDIALSAFATPGHTSDSISLQAGDAIFIGDTLFSPQYGTARCDFPGGSAVDLYRSVSRLMKEPDETRLYLCHDYPVAGEQPVAFSTVKQQKKNIHVGEGVSEAEFIELRKQRDAELDLPRLLLPAIQVNIRAGNWPEPEDNGTRYLKIPINKM